MKKSNYCVGTSLIFLVSLFFMPHLAYGADNIKYIGSSTVGKFIYDAQKVYTKATFTIDTKPESGGGENATAGGFTDIGGVARDVKPAILAKDVQQFLIGKDAIGVWVNANNPVEKLSLTQIRDIFTGMIKNWKEVGGKDMPIKIFIVNPQSATRKVFSNKVLGKGDYGDYGGDIKTIKPDEAIIDNVADNVGSIGQLSFALGNGHPNGAKVKKINIDGKPATVNNPDYPITRPLYLITKGEPKGAVKDFIEWAVSDAGQAIVKQNFVGK